MDRDIPSFNRPIMQRIYAKNQQLHLKRLKNIRSGVTSNKSYQKPNYANLNSSNSIVGVNNNLKQLPQYNNIKKQVIEQQKRSQIQRQNALLFNKMLKIMKRPDKNNDPSFILKQYPTANAAKQRISMEYSRINEENKTSYNRLQKQKPTIDNKKLEKQRLKNLNILKFLGKYPNQQIVSRVSDQNTFDMRTRRMNSTSNQIRYQNRSYRDEEQMLITEERDKYQKFRHQMHHFDNEFRQLRNQHQNVANNSANKYHATTANFYSPYQSNLPNQIKKNHRMSEGESLHTNTIQNGKINLIDEPSLPNRRKFMSQGANRKTFYGQAGGFRGQNKNDASSSNNQFQQLQYQNGMNTYHGLQQNQPYPYHLNHPSNNIIIDDISRHNRNKMSLQVREQIQVNEILPPKYYPPVNEKVQKKIQKAMKSGSKQSHPGQRKLNSRNSGKNLLSQKQKSIEDINKEQLKSRLKSKQKQKVSYQPHIKQNQGVSPPFQNFIHEHSNITSNKANINTVNAKLVSKIKASSNMNLITLFKTTVTLQKLLQEQQIYQIAEQIYNEYAQNLSTQGISIQGIRKGIIFVIRQWQGQIKVCRLDTSYTISINNLKNSSKKGLNIQENIQGFRFEQFELQLIRSIILPLIQSHFSNIKQIRLTQEEGSLLLQDIDYNYMLLIDKMLKIQRFNTEEENNEDVDDQDQADILEYTYKLVIVLKQEEALEISNEQHNINNKELIQKNQQEQSHQMIRRKLVQKDQTEQEQQQNQQNLDYYQNKEDKIIQNHLQNHLQNPFKITQIEKNHKYNQDQQQQQQQQQNIKAKLDESEQQQKQQQKNMIIRRKNYVEALDQEVD